MTLKLTIPKKRQAIPKRVQRRLHRESKSKRRMKVQSENSDDELICSYGDDRKRSNKMLNREIRLKKRNPRSSRSLIPSGDDDSSDENISKKLCDAANAAKCGVSSSSSPIKIKRHRLQTSIVLSESDKSSDDELVSFGKVQRSEESDDELVAGPKVRRGEDSDDELVALSKLQRGEDSDDVLVALPKVRKSEDSDDELVARPKVRRGEDSDDELVAVLKVRRGEDIDDELVVVPKVRINEDSDDDLVAVLKLRDESSDDELVAFRKVQRSKESGDELVAGLKVEDSDDELVALSKVQSGEDSDDELVAVPKVRISEEIDDELVAGPKVRKGEDSVDERVAVSGEDIDDKFVAVPKVPMNEDSDDELVDVPKLSQTSFSREESEKGESTSISSLKLRQSESDRVSDDKSVQKIRVSSLIEKVSLKIVAQCKETEEKGGESSSEDEFISISKSVSNGASVNRREPGPADEDAALNSDLTEGSSSKPSKSTPSDSESDDEPISISSKKKVGIAPSGNSKSQVNSKKRSPKKKKGSSKRPKKVYDMPGQKKDKPGELNGARIFYESLREQIPESKMAEEYLLKYGLLSFEEASAIVEGKPLPPRSAIKRNNTEKSAKRKRSPKIKEILSGESSSDDDIILTKKVKV